MMQRLQRFVVIVSQPLFTADTPGAIADFAEFQIRSAKLPIFHQFPC